MSTPEIRTADVVFDVWGCRGTRNLDPGFSRIGVKTSCYSLLSGPELIVFDAGKGLLMLAEALLHDQRFAAVERVHLFLSHSHMDHWEGLKDAVWFWRRSERPLEVTLYASSEALGVVRSAFAHPSFVPMETLASFAGIAYREEAIAAGEQRGIGTARLLAVPLNHYLGEGQIRKHLAALGFRVEGGNGWSVAYACDHEPDATAPLGLPTGLLGAALMVIDSYYGDEVEQGFGHGSMEFAARVAREHPRSLVLAGHLGPQFTDETIIASVLRHAAGIHNCRIAREGETYRWQETTGAFVSLPRERLAVAWGAAASPETPEGLRPGGETRIVTILVADLRGFTAMAHEMSPQQVMQVLNTYLGRMIELISRHRGTIEELVGDAILAFFGAPTAAGDDAERAVRCALEMQLAMDEVNDQLTAASLPLVELGIGLNTGEVVAG
jgi:phosphoribosyl 1,2-cyclic phosphodiesterase